MQKDKPMLTGGPGTGAPSGTKLNTLFCIIYQCILKKKVERTTNKQSLILMFVK